MKNYLFMGVDADDVITILASSVEDAWEQLEKIVDSQWYSLIGLD